MVAEAATTVTEGLTPMSEPIILYTSRYCMHSRSVERFLEKHEISVKVINIDGDQEARQTLIEINSGYASVPTLVSRMAANLRNLQPRNSVSNWALKCQA